MARFYPSLCLTWRGWFEPWWLATKRPIPIIASINLSFHSFSFLLSPKKNILKNASRQWWPKQKEKRSFFRGKHYCGFTFHSSTKGSSFFLRNLCTMFSLGRKRSIIISTTPVVLVIYGAMINKIASRTCDNIVDFIHREGFLAVSQSPLPNIRVRLRNASIASVLWLTDRLTALSHWHKAVSNFGSRMHLSKRWKDNQPHRKNSFAASYFKCSKSGWFICSSPLILPLKSKYQSRGWDVDEIWDLRFGCIRSISLCVHNLIIGRDGWSNFDFDELSQSIENWTIACKFWNRSCWKDYLTYIPDGLSISFSSQWTSCYNSVHICLIR